MNGVLRRSMPAARRPVAPWFTVAFAVAFVAVLGSSAGALEPPGPDPDEDEDPDARSNAKAKADTNDALDWADEAPAPMDAPQLRNVEPRTRIYVDGSLAQTGDLSALPNIGGSGRNLRLAAGGSWKWRRFQFDAELPASQATTLDLVSPNPAIVYLPEDTHQTALSIGDLRAGAQWTHALSEGGQPLVGGFGLRGRIPTHTTRFQFHLVNGDLGVYVLPYYFHIEPTLLLGGAWGPVSFVTNQGALILMGPDGDFVDLHITVPTITFWDAHYALAWRMVELLAVSVEVNTTIQLNHVSGLDFQKLNGVRSVVVVPGLQVHLGRYRVDALARFGVTRGAELLGVVGFAGTRAFTLRVSRVFD